MTQWSIPLSASEGAERMGIIMWSNADLPYGRLEFSERQAFPRIHRLHTPPKTLLCPPSAAAAAKSLQSCLTLCNPMDSSPSGSSVPGILQARKLEWVAISFYSVLLQSSGQILTSALLFTLPCPLLPTRLALQFLGLGVLVSWIGSRNKSYGLSRHFPDLGPHKVSIQINRTVLRNTVWICLPY